MNRLSVMGVGFVGSAYCRLYPDETFPELRASLVSREEDVLFTRSTVSNYNVLKPETLKLDVQTNLEHFLDVLPNVRGTFNHISSWFVYGRAPGEVCNWAAPAMWRDEYDECWPTGFYSITKRASEQLLQSYCATVQAGLVKGPSSYRILRLCNVMGNDLKAGKQKNALEYLLQKVVCGEDVSVYEGDNYRNHMHVNDVCRAIHLVLEKPQTLNSITNIGAPESVKLIDLITHAINVTGSKSKIVHVPVPAFHKIVQVPDFWMNTNRLQSLGFKPEMDAFQAVDKVLEGIYKDRMVNTLTDVINATPYTYDLRFDEDIFEADTYRGLTLVDKGDTVAGHYLIGHECVNSPTTEYWTANGWKPYGEVFMSRAEAVEKRKELIANGYTR